LKKEFIIKKAAEQGYSITEEQAEKFSTLSDEELENLNLAGGGCGDPPEDTRVFGDILEPSSVIVINDAARAPQYCDFTHSIDGNPVTNCSNCQCYTSATDMRTWKTHNICYNFGLVNKVRFSRVI
jgi:hypothetical protein